MNDESCTHCGAYRPNSWCSTDCSTCLRSSQSDYEDCPCEDCVEARRRILPALRPPRGTPWEVVLVGKGVVASCTSKEAAEAAQRLLGGYIAAGSP